MTFTLRFPENEVQLWSSRYPVEEDARVEEISSRVRSRGYFTKEEFLALCRWKTHRTKKRCAENDEDFVRAVTQTALSTTNERLRIEVLTLLKGVGWATASVILHFGSTDPYPILDSRALSSLGVEQDSYDYSLWWSYVQCCRRLASQLGIPMRELDRALWQYSKEQG